MTRALVIGCSQRVWSDVERAEDLCSFETYYLVKLAGAHWDGEDHFVWATLHPEFMPRYRAERASRGLHSRYEIVGPLAEEVGRHAQCPVDRRVSYRWPKMTSSGSSGLFAVKVALDDGHDRVVLAGVPMSTEAGHFVRRTPWLQRDSFVHGWNSALQHIHGKVRSVSGGWTEQLLGAPTKEWLGVSPDRAAGATPATEETARG